MKYKNLIILFGVLIAIIASSFVGLPRSWKDGAVILLALTISVLAYLPPKREAVIERKAEPQAEVPPSINP